MNELNLKKNRHFLSRPFQRKLKRQDCDECLKNFVTQIKKKKIPIRIMINTYTFKSISSDINKKIDLTKWHYA